MRLAVDGPVPREARVNFAIHYLTNYRYRAAVTDNLNALRVRPMTNVQQRCEEFQVRVEPETRLGRHSDYFGTEVIEFGIAAPHSSLTIDVRARVVTTAPCAPPDPSWQALGAPQYREAAGEYLLASIQEPEGPPSAGAGGVLEELWASSAATTPLRTAIAVVQS